MTARWTSTDPRSAGRDEAVGSTILYVTGGAITFLVKYGSGSTNWVAANDPTRIVTSDPRTGGGLDARVGTAVLYYSGFSGPGDATRLVKYGTGATQWATWSSPFASASHTHAESDITNLTTDLAAKAPIASPTFTGTPSGPSLTLDTGTPSAPSSGKVIAFGKDVGGRQMLAARGPTGQVTPLAPHLGFSKRSEWLVTPNSSIDPTGVGIASPTGTGTATNRSVAAGSMFSWAKRVARVSAGTANSSCGYHGSVLLFGLGDAAGAGGFTFVARFGISDASSVANARMFVGLRNSITVIGSTTDPSTLTDIIGVGCDTGGTNLYMMHNDASGSATTVDLTSTFPTNTRSTDLFQLELYCVPNGSSVGYRVTRLNTGDTTAGTLSSNLPSPTTLMSPHIWRNNGSTATAVGIDLMGLYIETDV